MTRTDARGSELAVCTLPYGAPKTKGLGELLPSCTWVSEQTKASYGRLHLLTVSPQIRS